MKNKMFIDTGAFYARYVQRDQYHKKAIALWEELSQTVPNVFTTNFVVSELITLLSYRFGTSNALITAHEIYASNFINTISVDKNIELKALNWLEQYSDQKLSMTDATSFAFMKENKIKKTFSFDKHFEIVGFELV